VALAITVALLQVVGGYAVKKYMDRPASSPGIFAFLSEKTALPLPDKPSIAVLPFENMTGDPKQEFFTDGFTEQIITSLSKISSLFVISRNSSFTYKGKPGLSSDILSGLICKVPGHQKKVSSTEKTSVGRGETVPRHKKWHTGFRVAL
jgi:hypothetical protein